MTTWHACHGMSGWMVVSEYELTCIHVLDDYPSFNSIVMMGLDLLVSDLDEEFDAFAIPPLCRVFSSRQMSAKFLHPKQISSKQMSNSSLSDAGSRHCETVGGLTLYSLPQRRHNSTSITEDISSVAPHPPYQSLYHCSKFKF